MNKLNIKINQWYIIIKKLNVNMNKLYVKIYVDKFYINILKLYFEI